jgi:hypothetical protein
MVQVRANDEWHVKMNLSYDFGDRVKSAVIAYFTVLLSSQRLSAQRIDNYH